MVLTLSLSDKAALKALKVGKKLYFYVNDDGSLGQVGIFKEGMDSSVYSAKDLFKERADFVYEAKGQPNVKGCRINPSFMELAKVSPDFNTATVKGLVFNVYDPVIGDAFDTNEVRALYDGSYYYTGLSPMAETIKTVVDEQRHHFSKMNEDPEAKKLLDKTANLLKPHAYEAFHKQDDLVYFITKAGQWVALNLGGNRSIDAVDRNRLRKYMETEGLTGAEGQNRIEQAKQTFHKLPLYDRFDTKALLPLMQKELDKHKEADALELERIKNIQPRYNEIELLPGLKDNVEYPPHQIYLFNKIKDRDRILVDADAGCFGKGTKILMADGSIKLVEDICVGDQVMGPDSKPRNVLVLKRGQQKMYKITPIKGASWICNESHILSLKMTPYRDNKYQRDQIVNISIQDFLGKIPMFRSNAKLWRTGVAFSKLDTLIDPYFAGSGTKIVPKEFMINDEKTRLQFLAGLLDSDGHYTHQGYYEIVVKNIDMANDVLYLARSLGFAAYMRARHVKYAYKGVVSLKLSHRISIFGNLDKIPCRIPRKKDRPRQQVKDVCVTGFSLAALPQDDFYGFTVDGDHLFLLDDFTVVHNCGKSLVIISDILYQLSKDKIKRPLIIVPDEGLASQFASEVSKFSDLNPWVISTGSVHKWKDGDINVFLVDAASAPENTVFISTYNWISRDADEVDSGHIDMKEGKYSYSKTTVFQRSYKLLQDLGVDYVALDECHILKNESNKSTAASILARAKQVKAFSGTIMPGNLVDVLGPMGVVHSGVLGTVDEFVSKYSPTETINSYHDTAPKDIRKELQDFGVPQVRSTAWASLMPKTSRLYHYVEFNKVQEKAYESLLQNATEEIEKDPKLKSMFEKFKVSLDSSDEVVISPILLARFTPLEIFLNSPSAASPYLKAILAGEDAKSPKIRKINEIAAKHLSNKDNGKVLIFTQFQESAKNILEDLDPNLKQQAAYYQGGMVDVLSQFKNPDSDLKILIGVDKTLRTGYNLQAANCIIHADTLWLSGDMRQREARAARIKQTRPVYIHHVILHNSNELLKNARVLAQENLIAKANSDFEDKEIVAQIDMTLSSMKSFRSLDKLDPYIKKQQKLAEYQAEQGEKDKKVFGTRLVKPQQYVGMAKGKKLAVVPSTGDFEGNSNAASYLIEKELEELPENPSAPKLIKFHLQNWDGKWLLTCFKSSDTQGFVRRLGFMLQTPYMYVEIPNKGGISKVIEDIESQDIEIVNKEALESGAFRIRSVSSPKNVLRNLERQSKQAVNSSVRTQLEFHFGTIDNFPFVYCDNLKFGSKEALALKKVSFKEGFSFWYLLITRTRLTNIMRKFQENYKDVKIADWQQFQDQVSDIFKLDLKDFEGVGHE